MAIYAGLDVSDKMTHIYVVDGEGEVLHRKVVASDPATLADWLGRHCPALGRVVLETGPLSTFLYHGLAERGIPVICICARHAKGVLSTRVNKSDAHDAEGLAQLALTGWFKSVHMKGRGHAYRLRCAQDLRAAGLGSDRHGRPAARSP